MRTFKMIREEDISGTSGVGIVAEGVEFTSGWVALTWISHLTTFATYPSVAAVEAVHGHGGTTKVVFDDVIVPSLDTVKRALLDSSEVKPKKTRKKRAGTAA